MKICYCTARGSPSEAFRRRLQALPIQLVDAAGLAGGLTDCAFCLLALPDELDAAVELTRQQRQALPAAIHLVACGPWLEAEPVRRLLDAGAADYLPTDTETRQLALRLQLFEHTFSRPAAGAAEAEEALIRSHRLETLAGLTGRIAHDYNNLLSAIQGNAELALMEPSLEAPVRYSLDQIKSAAQRAAQITRQIVLFRGGGANAKTKQGLNLSHLVQESSELVRVSLARNCRIEYQLESDLPLVLGDSLRLGQLLLILAADASATLECGGGGVVRIRTCRGDGGENGHVALEVDYTGVAPALAPCTASPRGEKTAAPMNAAHAIARGHGTTIASSLSETGGFHRVIFASTGDRPLSTAGAMPGEHRPAAGAILVIDDDEPVRVAAQRLLRRAGYAVFEAATGEEGLAVVAQLASSLDAVLLDLTLDGLECRDLLTQLRALSPKLRIVVWSGYPEDAARKQLAGLGNVAYLEKPAQLAELPSRLGRVLSG